MPFATADLYDENADKLQVAEPMFNDYGGVSCFCGPIATVKVLEDNVLVRSGGFKNQPRLVRFYL
jgi:regulator of ribonuclease activity A